MTELKEQRFSVVVKLDFRAFSNLSVEDLEDCLTSHLIEAARKHEVYAGTDDDGEIQLENVNFPANPEHLTY